MSTPMVTVPMTLMWTASLPGKVYPWVETQCTPMAFMTPMPPRQRMKAMAMELSSSTTG